MLWKIPSKLLGHLVMLRKESNRQQETWLKLQKMLLNWKREGKEIYDELTAKNKILKENANQDYHRHGQNIGRQIKTISASIENVRTKAEELVKLISSPGCPQSISILLFAEKIVSNCTNQRSFNAIFATCRVIVLVTSKVIQDEYSKEEIDEVRSEWATCVQQHIQKY